MQLSSDRRINNGRWKCEYLPHARTRTRGESCKIPRETAVAEGKHFEVIHALGFVTSHEAPS